MKVVFINVLYELKKNIEETFQQAKWLFRSQNKWTIGSSVSKIMLELDIYNFENVT